LSQCAGHRHANYGTGRVKESGFALRGKDLAMVGEFTVGAGETIAFVFTCGPSNLTLPVSLCSSQ